MVLTLSHRLFLEDLPMPLIFVIPRVYPLLEIQPILGYSEPHIHCPYTKVFKEVGSILW